MDRRKKVNEEVRSALTQSLLALLEEKGLDEVSVSELVQRADVGRVSFYRNFESLEDVIVQHIASIVNEQLPKFEHQSPREQWLSLFAIFSSIKSVALPLHEANRDVLVYRFIKQVASEQQGGSSGNGYRTAIIAGVVFGIYEQWVSTGAKESPEELVEIVYRSEAVPGR